MFDAPQSNRILVSEFHLCSRRENSSNIYVASSCFYSLCSCFYMCQILALRVLFHHLILRAWKHVFRIYSIRIVVNLMKGQEKVF